MGEEERRGTGSIKECLSNGEGHTILLKLFTYEVVGGHQKCKRLKTMFNTRRSHMKNIANLNGDRQILYQTLSKPPVLPPPGKK